MSDSHQLIRWLVEDRAPGGPPLPERLPLLQAVVRWDGLRPRFLGFTDRDEADAPIELVGWDDPGGSVSTREMADWINDRTLGYTSDLMGLTYVGPLREPPVRFNILSGERTTAVGVRGENLVELLVQQPRLIRSTNKWLERLGVPYEVAVRQVKDTDVGQAIGDMHYMLLRDRRTGIHVSPTDVGFGIGQVLPVVVQAVSHRGLLCVEQPELHLHPAMQSELAELFVDQIAQGQNSKQFILETHSEHLLLRMQRLIRRGTLEPQNVILLHVGQEAAGAEVRVIRLGRNGDFIDPWPSGFFDEHLDELFED